MSPRLQLWPAARIAFVGALVLFVFTIAVGVLNGLDVYAPSRDVLLGHVHAGTIGWITLAVAGSSLLVFTDGRRVPRRDLIEARGLMIAMTVTAVLFVAAFVAGDGIPGHRVSRPIAGAGLLAVVAWFVVWLYRIQKDVARTVARLGLLLAQVSMLIGGAFGILLGLALSGHRVLGLSPDMADAIAHAHPASMLIGFLLLTAFSMIEWLLGDVPVGTSATGVAQMWILFAAGVIVNIGFALGIEDLLIAPATVAMIAGMTLLVTRRHRDLAPAAWRGGSRPFSRVALLFLGAYIVMLIVILARFEGGRFTLGDLADLAVLSPPDHRLLAAFDHTMFLGVMTNVLFGTLAATFHGAAATRIDRLLVWGVGVGTAGFVGGLIAGAPVLERVFTPVLGVALLFGVGAYLREILATPVEAGAPGVTAG
jgi:hypothetical protein